MQVALMKTRLGVAAILTVVGLVAMAHGAPTPAAGEPQPAVVGDQSRPDNGCRGIWFTLGQVSEYGDKYSGGLGTYTANHIPWPSTRHRWTGPSSSMAARSRAGVTS